MIAKAGNHPECIAAIPTINIATVHEIAAHNTHRISINILICVTIPEITAITTAPARYKKNPITIVFLASVFVTVIFVCTSVSLFLCFVSFSIIISD